jgi:hypothetical protein
MNSNSLKENGFADFIPLKGLPFSSLPYNKCSVLVIADCTLTGKPTSDIVYIGKSKKPTKRVFGGYIGGYGGKATKKIHAALFDDGFIEKAAISWMESDNPKTAQQELLDSFKKEHGVYPVWNASKKPAQKPKVAPKATKTTHSRKSAKPTQ